eukprot:223780-Chlamydomonas_euryale.AAC.6
MPSTAPPAAAAAALTTAAVPPAGPAIASAGPASTPCVGHATTHADTASRALPHLRRLRLTAAAARLGAVPARLAACGKLCEKNTIAAAAATAAASTTAAVVVKAAIGVAVAEARCRSPARRMCRSLHRMHFDMHCRGVHRPHPRHGEWDRCRLPRATRLRAASCSAADAAVDRSGRAVAPRPRLGHRSAEVRPQMNAWAKSPWPRALAATAQRGAALLRYF